MICKQKKREAIKFYLVLLLLFVLLLSGCSHKSHISAKPSVKNGKQNSTTANIEKDWKLPIEVPSGEFNKAVGWVSENQVLYITNQEQTSNVYRYNLLSGKSDLVYQSDHPITNVQISPSKKFMLIQSAPSTYQGVIHIIDQKGNELLKQTFTAYEADFEWNPFNESIILVTMFNEDWTYQVSLLDLENSRFTQISLPQPFIKWVGKEEITFLNWNEDKSTLFAPLIEKKLGSDTEQTLFPSVYQFSAFQNILMTITVNGQERSTAAYSFYDKEKKQIFSFSIPQLSKYSDWLVPFYDYNSSKEKFLTFRPLQSGEEDSYTKGFDLVEYDLKTGSSKLIKEGMENVPINFSPSGETLLYGNQFEKIMDIYTKKEYGLTKDSHKN